MFYLYILIYKNKNKMDAEPEDKTDMKELCELKFVKPLHNIIHYKKDQKELVDKAIIMSNGESLNALKYIVLCMAHEGFNVEFSLVIRIPNLMNKKTGIYLPIITHSDKEQLEGLLGFYVNWGDGEITNGYKYHEYTTNKDTDFEIRIFGLNITGFGNTHTCNFKKYLIKVNSFGNLGHNFTSLESAFYMCKNLQSIPLNFPESVTNLKYMFNGCIKSRTTFGQHAYYVFDDKYSSSTYE